MRPADVIGAITLTVGLGLTAWWAMDSRRISTDLIEVELRLGRELSLEAVRAFLGALSGLLPQGRRPKAQPFVSLEVLASHRGIRHRLVAPAALRHSIEAAMAAHLPRVGYAIRTSVDYPELTGGVELRLTSGDRPLAVDETLGPRTLASLQPLARGEEAVVQVVIGPARGARPARVASASEKNRSPFTRPDGVRNTSEAAGALRHKQSHPLLLACLRLGVRTDNAHRDQQLIARVGSTWRSTRAPGVSLRRRHLPPRGAARRITQLVVPRSSWPVLLNTKETAALIAWPTTEVGLPGIERRGCPPLPVPTPIPHHGAVLGEGTHPRTTRPVGMSRAARRHHLLVTGPTGSGKSVLATRLAVSDAAAGQGLIVLDPKDGELVDLICERLPAKRLDDVIVLDPTDAAPVGFDPLGVIAGEHELVVDRVLHLMTTIWGANLGPRSADILRHLLLTISLAENLTLVEAPQLLTDPVMRRRTLKRLAGHTYGVREWWSWFESLSDKEAAAMSAAPLNKLRAFVGRSSVADTIGQPDPRLDLAEVLRSGRILLLRLPAGVLGEETVSLLGALLVTQMWSAISARAGVPSDRRRPASVIIDEAATVLRFPGTSIDGLLTQSRGYGVGLTLLAQHLNQLPSDVRATALTNARTKVVFAPSFEDAALWAKHLGAGLGVDDLQEQDAFHAVAAVFADGRTQAPTTMKTLPLDEPLRDAAEVRSRSRRRWGVDRAEIREAMRRRIEAADEVVDGAVGRRRRAR